MEGVPSSYYSVMLTNGETWTPGPWQLTTASPEKGGGSALALQASELPLEKPHGPDPRGRAGLCMQALVILGGDESIISDLDSLGDGKTASSHTPGQKPLSGTHRAFNNRSACLSPLAKLDFLFNNRVRFNSVVN